jgi:hypothetical protein
MDRKKAEEIRRQMEGLYVEWKGSGETVRSFAARKGITSAKFFYWKKRLGWSVVRGKVEGGRAEVGVGSFRFML